MRNQIKLLSVYLLTLLCFFGCTTVDNNENRSISPPETSWRELQPGISYGFIQAKASQSGENKDLMVAIVDPKEYIFSVVQNQDSVSAKTIKEIHQQNGSLLTFNGGFFTAEFKPTGLLISRGQQLRKSSPAGLLNGIFTIDYAGKAELFSNDAILNETKYSFGIQNGPVLLDNQGRIKVTQDTGNASSRTAIGLDKNDNIVLVIMQQGLLNPDNNVTLYEFAHLLKEAPEFAKLGLHSMLNLDGGTSTGMMIADEYLPEIEKVQNVVIVNKRLP